MEDRYLDTADRALRNAGLVARVRTGHADPLLTLKGLDQRRGGLAHGRLELEGPAGPGDGPRAWPSSSARDRLLEVIVDRPLITLVRIHQRRLQREVTFGLSLLELSLDDVTIDGRRTWTELECELLQGQESDLEALGSLLLARGGVARVATSKLERALATGGTFTER